MPRPKQGLQKVLSAVATTTAGVPLDVTNYRHVVFQLYTSGSATCTVKFAVSMSNAVPNFNNAASPTNVWTYVQVKDLDTAAAINGDTGIPATGTDIIKTCEVNTNYVKWFCPIVTSISAGSVSMDMDAINDDVNH